MTLREAAGQVLIVGLEGTQLSSLEAAWLRLLRPGGVILFRRNIESSAQTHALLHCTQQAVGSPMLRCIDVEGGSVDRLRDLIAPMPSPFAVAATNKPALFKKHGSLIGQESHLLGLNTAFAPVLDLRTDASAPVMTTRVVSGDPAQVTRYAIHFLEGRNTKCWAAESISLVSAAGKWIHTMPLRTSPNLSACSGKKICCPIVN
jgi:beta-N-acetylhexosaminidase